MKNLSTSYAFVALALSVFFLADFWLVLTLPNIAYYLLIVGMVLFSILAFFVKRDPNKRKLLFLAMVLIVISLLSLLSPLVLA